MHPTQMRGWSPYQPPVSGRLGGLRDRVFRHSWVALVILAAGLVAGYNRTGRGLLAMGLAWAVVSLLKRHRGERVRTLIEYAVVGALAFALVTAAPVSKAKPPAARRKPPAEQATADPWADLRARVAELRERLSRVEVTTTKEGR